MLKNKIKIAVSGSLAYDQIMDFPGTFSEHILPESIHNLNLSFLVNNLTTSFGGTAGNIAYNLSLFNIKPIILGIVGFDFLDYQKWLKQKGIDSRQVKIVPSAKTATAYIITDQKDNQIASFYPGPSVKNYVKAIARNLKNIDLAIISPDNKKRMLEYATFYRTNKIPFIFDPGQALTAFNAKDLSQGIKGAKVLIGNDYEIELVAERLKLSLSELQRLVEILVITKGGQGSEIYQGGRKIIVKSAKPKNTSDPTGAGDAYRAGLIKGLISGYNLKTCGQIAALAAVYTVEKYGTQTHAFSLLGFKKRYKANFGEMLKI